MPLGVRVKVTALKSSPLGVTLKLAMFTPGLLALIVGAALTSAPSVMVTRPVTLWVLPVAEPRPQSPRAAVMGVSCHVTLGVRRDVPEGMVTARVSPGSAVGAAGR